MRLPSTFTDKPEWDARPPMVFESKTHHGQWFWLNPNGLSGWERTKEAATMKATDGLVA